MAVIENEIKARPILFSTPMVQALLDGKKTQTRRIVQDLSKNHPLVNLADYDDCYSGEHNDPNSWGYAYADDYAHAPLSYWIDLCPYGKIGDLLWVRETFCPVDDTAYGEGEWVDYRATPKYEETHPAGWEIEPDHPEALKWKPSIFMPRKYSRITLEITDVRVERLQDISEEDAEAEGTRKIADDRPPLPMTVWSYKANFEELWQSINGKESWDANPWVWAMGFQVHKQNVDEFMKGIEKND